MRTYLRVDIFEPRTITSPTHFPVRRKFQIFIISRTKHILNQPPIHSTNGGHIEGKKLSDMCFQSVTPML